MTPPPPGFNSPNVPPSSDGRNGRDNEPPSQDPLLADLRGRVFGADFAPRVAVIMFCDNISAAYAGFTEEQLDDCREVYMLRDHMRDSRDSGFSDLVPRFHNAWKGIKEEIADRCAGSPHLAQKVAAFFIGHLVSETGWCVLTRDVLAEIQKVHSRLEAVTMRPFRRDIDTLQYRIEYLMHDQGISLQGREQLIVAKQREQVLAGRRALGDVVQAHNEIRARFGIQVEGAVSELESSFLTNFRVEDRFHDNMVRTMTRAFREPFENMLAVYFRHRHDQIAQYLTKRGVLQPGEDITPLLSGAE